MWDSTVGLMTDSMDTFYLGDRIEVIVGPDKARFAGVMTNWDDVAIYISGLGFPREDILEMNHVGA